MEKVAHSIQLGPWQRNQLLFEPAGEHKPVSETKWASMFQEPVSIIKKYCQMDFQAITRIKIEFQISLILALDWFPPQPRSAYMYSKLRRSINGS